MSFEYFCTIFFIIVSVVSFHTYILYPVSIYLISFFYKDKGIIISDYPAVTILISAYNEEKVIRKRLENISDLDYDLDKIEVIIGSDSSTDKTNEILLELKDTYSWLKVEIYKIRRGKAAVLNDLIKISENELIVFSDANTHFHPDSLKYLIQEFSNSTIGGVCGRLVLVEPEQNSTKSIEEKKYWDYETFIKKAEGKCGILIGANGGIFAIRKKLFEVIPITKAVTDDLFISISVLKKKYQFVYSENAIAVEEISKTVLQEIKRKIRFSATNYQTLYFFKELLFHRNFLLSYAFWSHKILRWVFPFFMIILLTLNIYLLNLDQLFKTIFIIQVIFYSLAFLGFIFSFFKIRISIFSLPFFFVVSNFAIILGFLKFLTKKHSVIWQTTER
jgi:poly-beta-1,6-N-acetyl-D-glucosamine synthase